MTCKVSQPSSVAPLFRVGEGGSHRQHSIETKSVTVCSIAAPNIERSYLSPGMPNRVCLLSRPQPFLSGKETENGRVGDNGSAMEIMNGGGSGVKRISGDGIR